MTTSSDENVAQRGGHAESSVDAMQEAMQIVRRSFEAKAEKCVEWADNLLASYRQIPDNARPRYAVRISVAAVEASVFGDRDAAALMIAHAIHSLAGARPLRLELAYLVSCLGLLLFAKNDAHVAAAFNLKRRGRSKASPIRDAYLAALVDLSSQAKVPHGQRFDWAAEQWAKFTHEELDDATVRRATARARKLSGQP